MRAAIPWSSEDIASSGRLCSKRALCALSDGDPRLSDRRSAHPSFTEVGARRSSPLVLVKALRAPRQNGRSYIIDNPGASRIMATVHAASVQGTVLPRRYKLNITLVVRS